MPRNIAVGNAVDKIIHILDNLISGNSPSRVPSTETKNKIDVFLKTTSSGSVILASTFLLSYSTLVENYKFTTVPTGVRGKYGDKKLSNELNRRHVTIHNRIVAFGENLGWKGNVINFDLSKDDRFSILQFFSKLSQKNKEVALHYLVWNIYDSISKPKAIPKFSGSYLTYGRCVKLFDKIIRKKSEGYFPQFLISAILKVHRNGMTDIVTHHPHAADKYDNAVGDIEEYYNEKLIAAYEVTVRPDWRNRIESFREKMLNHGLNKYVIIAGDVASNNSTNSVDALLKFTESTGFDLAVVDIFEFIRVFAADMTTDQLIKVINTTHEYLLDDKLCGRVKMIDDFQKMINRFIKEQNT